MSPLFSGDGTIGESSTCVEFDDDSKTGAQQKAQHSDGTSPDLAELIALWPGLPSEVQAQILRLAQQARSAAECPQ